MAMSGDLSIFSKVNLGAFTDDRMEYIHYF